MSFLVSPRCFFASCLGRQASPAARSPTSSPHSFPAFLLCGPFSSCQHSQPAGRGCQLEAKQSLRPSGPATLFNPLLIFLLFSQFIVFSSPPPQCLLKGAQLLASSVFILRGREKPILLFPRLQFPFHPHPLPPPFPALKPFPDSVAVTVQLNEQLQNQSNRNVCCALRGDRLRSGDVA